MDAEIEEMRNNQSWVEATCMAWHITPTVLSLYLDDFRQICRLGGVERHKHMQDCYYHFRDWLAKRLNKHGTGHDRRTSAEYIADAQRRGIEEAEQFVRAAKARRGEIQDPATG